MIVKATGQTTRGAYDLIEQELPPGFSPPPHIHHAEDEAFYILEGSFTFYVDGEPRSVSAGGYIFLPRDVPHWFRVESETPARLLQFNFPAGLEAFFREVG